MRKILLTGIAALMLTYYSSVPPASAGVSIGIGLPNVSIGINLPLYPELVPVPGYPVYYAPRLEANYFFYDGMYWVFLDDYWYSSYWYDGPWWVVEPDVVPVFILRIPVRYYRYPPPYFRGWRSEAPPRWGEHWGREWEHNRRGWDKWKHSSAPARAPLPAYQRNYSGDSYPREAVQQQEIRRQNYRYQARDKSVRRHFEQRGEQRTYEPVRRERQEEPRLRSPSQQEQQRPVLPKQGGAAGARSQQPYQAPPQQRAPEYQERRQQPQAVPYERQAPQTHGQEQRYEERGQGPRDRGYEERRDDNRGRERGN